MPLSCASVLFVTISTKENTNASENPAWERVWEGGERSAHAAGSHGDFCTTELVCKYSTYSRTQTRWFGNKEGLPALSQKPVLSKSSRVPSCLKQCISTVSFLSPSSFFEPSAGRKCYYRRLPSICVFWTLPFSLLSGSLFIYQYYILHIALVISLNYLCMYLFPTLAVEIICLCSFGAWAQTKAGIQ